MPHMNFVQNLEECLRDLAAEARKKHPGVKEASERATLRLRALQSNYVSAVRRAATQPDAVHHPTTNLFQSSDLLHPFLLAANYPNADYKLLEISFRAMRLLMEADAIPPADAIHMVRVYQIQAHVATAFYQKQYAREIQKAAAAAANSEADNENDDVNDNDPETNTNTTTDTASLAAQSHGTCATTTTTATTTSSSWFSWGIGSSTSSTTSNAATSTVAATSTTHPSTTKETSKAVLTKTAVSSSTGKSGQASMSGPHVEKLALEILSSLLQLMELILRNYPTSVTVELWTNAMSVACFGLHDVPARHTVQQAAKSTVMQLVSLLVQPPQPSPRTSGEVALKLITSTWDDLLILCDSDRRKQQQQQHRRHPSSSTTITTATTTMSTLTPLAIQGAFALCKRDSNAKTVAGPPSPEFALELMIQVWKDKTKNQRKDSNTNTQEQVSAFQPSEALILKTMGVTMTLLQQLPKQSIEKSLRVVQWTLVLFQSLSGPYPIECRELFALLLKPICAASDACRKHHDFEDGYVFDHTQNDEASFLLSSSIMGDDTHGTTKEMSKHKALTTVVPSFMVWKAGFALEAVYCILEQQFSDLSVLLDDSSIVQSLTESLSDFATIMTSCRGHILQAVDFCRLQNLTHQKPTVFRKAEQALATGTMPSDNLYLSGSSAHSATSDKQRLSPMVLGETIWLAMQGVLRISDCLLSIPPSHDDRKRLLDDIFSPSLALWQHFLKRIVGSKELVELSLKGYVTLADVCLPLEDCSLQRKALLTSLSKLSLPSWGKRDPNSLLHDHHVRSLLCLLRIVHSHFDAISTGWDIILWTFEELSTLTIDSPLLSEEAYHASLAISAAYRRFAGFSTCVSDPSFALMAEALTEICRTTMEKRDVVGDSETVLPEKNFILDEKSSSDEKEASISGRIMSIGVRALYGSAISDSKDVTTTQGRTKKSYYEDYRDDFIRKISSSSITVRTNTIGRVPFALILLSDIAMKNLFRSAEFTNKVSSEFFNLAATTPAVRPFVMDLITLLTMYQLNPEERMPLIFEGKGQVVIDQPMHSQLLAVEVVKNQEMHIATQTEVLTPLCESIRTTARPDAAKSSLEILGSIVEGAGQILQAEAWSMVIDAIASLSGDVSYHIDRSSPGWSTCCLISFRTLKLVVDDFLEHLPSVADAGTSAHVSLLDCCSSFVVSRHDINTSLTAIGLLWTIADRDPDSAAIDRALSKLVHLSSDDRPEVRNAAVNTLFSCIVGKGAGFSPPYWKSCFTCTIFGVYNVITFKIKGETMIDDSVDATLSRYKVSMHHSRDSAEKLWVATQVLVFRGLARVLRTFFYQLLDTVDYFDSYEEDKTEDTDWLQITWEKVLGFAFDAATRNSGRDNVEIRGVGVELLVLCCQLASKEGIHAAVMPARVSTTMEVVNGALRNVRNNQSANAKVARERAHSMSVEKAREKLFEEAFESLSTFEDVIINKMSDPDDTDIQILNKLGSGLSKVYECGRNNEFLTDNATKSLMVVHNTGREATTPFEEDFESRFVRLTVSILKASGGDSKSRFLNQCQRGSLEILRAMACDGSVSAFECLVSLAGNSFFLRKDSEGDESENAEDSQHDNHVSLLNFEASAIVSQEISAEYVSDECRMCVLYLILDDFLSAEDEDKESKMELKRRRYYKRFIPIVKCGLEGSSALAKNTDNDDCLQAVTKLWKKVIECILVMLTPVTIGNGVVKIARVNEVLLVVDTSVLTVPEGQVLELCEALCFGSLSSYESAKQHAMHAETSPESDFGKKCKRCRDDLLKLFYCCFFGCATLNPEFPVLRTISETILGGTMNSNKDSLYNLSVDASLMICKAMQECNNTGSLVISQFSRLCQLVFSDSRELRDAVGFVFTSVNVADTLQQAQQRYQDAEKRASQAEERIKELEAQVQALKSESAKSDTRRGIWM